MNHTHHNNMRKFIEFIFRLIALPFVVGITLFARLRDVLFIAFYFMKYGGEWVTHVKGDKTFLSDIYAELKAKRENNLPDES